MSTISEDYKNESLEKIAFQEQSSPFYKKLDYFPLISKVTGIIRVQFGYIQTMFGIITAPIELITNLCFEGDRKYTFIEGIRNTFRGYVAQQPIIGNVALYFYDQL